MDLCEGVESFEADMLDIVDVMQSLSGVEEDGCAEVCLNGKSPDPLKRFERLVRETFRISAIANSEINKKSGDMRPEPFYHEDKLPVQIALK